MRVVTITGVIKIAADRSELIALATELLKRAATAEFDFDSESECSSEFFEFDEPLAVQAALEGITFVREEEPTRQSALERAPRAALDGGD